METMKILHRKYYNRYYNDDDFYKQKLSHQLNTESCLLIFRKLINIRS